MEIRKTKALLILGSVLLLAQMIFAEDDELTVGTDYGSLLSNKAPDDLLYKSPHADPSVFYFVDHFDDQERFSLRWIKSQAEKYDTADKITKYDGEWALELPQKLLLPKDLGLVLKSKAKHAAIASRLNRPFVFSDKPLILQYEVNLQDGQECGGSYIKLLSSGKDTTDLTQFSDKTPYTIMFGPDKCGNDIKLHFIFRHVNPLNGTITEKHCRKAKDRLDDPFKDKQPHLYQLIIRPDNTYIIRVDHKTINEGSLFTEFIPPVNPPKEIDDPNDFKPDNWDEREKIPDPNSVKPDDWNEDEPPQIPDPNSSKPEGWLDDVEEMVLDPNAVKPVDWDVDMDGDWEAPLIINPVCEKVVGCGSWKAPLIPNPNYKGKWRSPLIDNPNYQGQWIPRKIANPDFFEDENPFKMNTITAIGIELWSMSSNILFDNLIIVDDETLARNWAAQTYDLKRKVIDREAETVVSRIMKFLYENPWMWAVLLVVVGLPLAIFIYFACSSKNTPSTITRAKKTDEYSTDNEETLISKPNLNSEEGNWLQSAVIDGQDAKEKYDDEEGQEEKEKEEDVKHDSNIEGIDSTVQLQKEIHKTAIETEDGVKKRKTRKE